MIPLRDITECDHCGVCCQKAPCLIAGPEELKRIVARVDVRAHIVIERTNAFYQVRISKSGQPCQLWQDNRCSIHTVKPSGGRDFKCWDRATYEKLYPWSFADLEQIGFRP